MAIDWSGFIQGVSDYGLERLKEERAKKMREDLMKLEDKYKEASELRERERKLREVMGTRDAAGQPGMVEDVNVEGTVLGTRPLDEYSQQERARAAAEHEARLKDSESQIRYRTEQAANDRARTQIMREGNSIARQAAQAGADAGVRDPITKDTDDIMNEFFRDARLSPEESFQASRVVREAVMQAPNKMAARAIATQKLGSLGLFGTLSNP